MARRRGMIVTALVAFLGAFLTTIPLQAPSLTAAKADSFIGVQDLNPCAPPNDVSFNVAETAWKLWVAATCPVNQTQYPYVVWENWIEQAQMYPADPSAGLKVPNSQAALSNKHTLHGSPLALLKNPSLSTTVSGLLGGADTNCNKAQTPPRNQPNLIICEEVRLNGATEDMVAGTNWWNRAGQAHGAAIRFKFEFPQPSIEIKADWIQLSSIGYDCGNLPSEFTSSVHVETINGNCFALAGMHFISKLKEKWIWATFEPQNSITNPYRCQVLGCLDTFGSSPSITRGTSSALTPALKALMTQAGLAPEWFNYRLDGVQTDFALPLLLGNSVIEGENAGVPLTQSSCITCHFVSSIKSDGTDGITLLKSNPVGYPAPLPSSEWDRRDFLWSLSMSCPNSPFQACSTR
jgi:hypothetical protein